MKKKKRMWKAWLVFFLVFSLFFCIPFVYGYIVTKDTKGIEENDSSKLKTIGYSLNDINIILKDKKVLEYALNNEYDSQLMFYVNVEDFNIEKINEYYEYSNNNKEAEYDKVIKLINYGITKNYSEKLMNIVNEKYFIKENLDRYLAYDKKDNSKEIVKYVNCNLDYDFYTNLKAANTDYKTLMLVNKYYYLNADFNGLDLTNIESNYGSGQVNSEAYLAFKKLSDAARNEGLSILARSTYRSYATQSSTYNNFLKTNGAWWTDLMSARPGHSEHQTGLSIDVTTSNISWSSNLRLFLDTREYAWMQSHAHEYGFIMRYPENSRDTTGYDFEPWHYRYVGIEAAKVIKEENILFEEYFAYYVNKKEES